HYSLEHMEVVMFKAVNKGILFSLSLLICHRISAQEVLDRIVAVVDDKIILQSELVQFTTQTAFQLGIDPQRDAEKFTRLREQALQNLINQKVLLTKAQEDSITVEERQIDQLLEDRMKTIVQQLGSEQKAEEYFGQPVRKIRRMFRDDIEEQLLVRNLQQKKMHDLKVSRREVEQFYSTYKDSLPMVAASVKLSHVLLNIQASEEAVQVAREKIESLQKRIREGEDFAKLAGEYSEDPGSSKRGGELGLIQRGDFVREFEEAAFGLEPDQVSEIVRTQFGFHIIKLIERRGEKINVRHILLRVPTVTGDEQRTREQAEQIRSDILAGKINFAEAAKKYSNDQTTNEKGGDLGWFETDQLQVTAFREAARTLAPGEISEPMKTEFGYHLVRLDEKRDARKLSLTEDWDRLHEMALNQKAEAEFQRWVESLKQQMYVHVVEGS
ncbi:MAG: peptidylprolyl isomerase, partial [bacterium]